MNITFTHPPPVQSSQQDMYLGTEKIGWLKTTDHASRGSKWHAGINIQTGESVGYDSFLVQGFGPEPQDAIDDAIEKAVRLSDRIRIEATSLMQQVHSAYKIDSQDSF